MTSNIEVSVVIVTYNSSRDIDTLLSTLRDQTYKNFEIIFVDNNSQDNIKDIVSKYKNIKFIRLPKNIGYGRACNIGAHFANGRYLVCLNPDIKLTPSFLEILYRTIQESTDIGMVCATSLFFNGDKIQSIGQSYELFTGYAVDLLFGTKITEKVKLPLLIQEKVSAFRSKHSLFSCNGVGFIIKRDLFKKIGGFSPYYFLYFEDVDLGSKLRRTGYRIVPSEALLFHKIDEKRAHNLVSRYYIEVGSLTYKLITDNLSKILITVMLRIAIALLFLVVKPVHSVPIVYGTYVTLKYLRNKILLRKIFKRKYTTCDQTCISLPYFIKKMIYSLHEF
ncbi:MAG: glycosyltransferase family 2 protein [Pyrobaculum sp.]|jgi:GT2 family glycosyltransferase